MEKINALIESHGCKVYGAVKEEDIRIAEKALGFCFPVEFRTFLSGFGTLEHNGDVILGLGPKGSSNTVNATLDERKLSRDFPVDCCIIFDLGMEGIMVLLGSDGRVYEWLQHTMKKIFDTFIEWLEKEFFTYD